MADIPKLKKEIGPKVAEINNFVFKSILSALKSGFHFEIIPLYLPSQVGPGSSMGNRFSVGKDAGFLIKAVS